MLALTILALALILTNGVAGYVYFTLKGQKLEKSASEKRATLSDAEQEAIQKYRSQREKHIDRKSVV